jgi:putative SOS response-associated peptidase YedK
MQGDDEIVASATLNSPDFRAWPVDRRVNNARNESEDLIEPAGEIRQA